MANIANVVGMKTNDYINKMKGNKMNATETAVETVVETTTKKKTETPDQEFIRKAGERLGRAKYAISLIGKIKEMGIYDKVTKELSAEQIVTIKKHLLDAVEKCDVELNKTVIPAAKKQAAKHFVRL